MKKQSNKTTSFSIFINPEIEKQLENGPLIRAVGQVIVYKTKEGEWGADVEIMDIEEIVLMGVAINKRDEMNKTLEHFRSMGINLYQVMQEELDEYFVCSGDVKQFVFEHIGIKLP